MVKKSFWPSVVSSDDLTSEIKKDHSVHRFHMIIIYNSFSEAYYLTNPQNLDIRNILPDQVYQS